jgi:hypothetical protein
LSGGALPSSLLCAALGLALAVAPKRARASCFVALGLTATAVAFLPLPSGWRGMTLLGCWVSIIASAASVHLRGRLDARLAVGLSVNAGLWSGAIIALTGLRTDLPVVLASALVFLPAAWITGRRLSIVVKTLSSWLIAIALLAATLQLLPVTPGYLPDHLE